MLTRIVKKIPNLIVFLMLIVSCNYDPLTQESAKSTTTFSSTQNDPNIIEQQNSSVNIIKKRVKVGVLLPLSGNNKELGQSVLNSVILSLFENDQDDNLELVVFDSKGQIKAAKKSMQQIIDRKIKIVIGPIFSNEVEAISSIAQDNNIIVLSLSSNQDLANKKNIFLMGFSPEQQSKRIINYAVDKGKGNFAIITANNKYSIKFASTLKEIIKATNGNLISGNFYFNNNKDLEKASKKAVDSYVISSRLTYKNQSDIKDGDKIYANVILIPESGPESGVRLSKITSAINKANINRRDIQIIGSINWDDMAALNDPNLDGEWFVATNPNKYKNFERSYHKVYGQFPFRISSIGYDAIDVVSRVIKQSSAQELSAKDLINYQSPSNGFDGIDGLFRFLPNGTTQRNFTILQAGNGEFEVIDIPATMF